MHRRSRAAGFVLATGIVTWALSERAFWGQIRPEDGIADSLVTLIAYCVVVYLVLLLVRRFQVVDAWRLLLAGAIAGWLVEGAVVATVYEALPFSIVWTGLAWHATISVVVGWYLLPRALRGGGWRALLAAAPLGVFLGGWSGFMRVDSGLSPDATVAGLTGALVAASLFTGYVLQHRLAPPSDSFRPGRDGWIASGLVVAWTCLVVVPAVPFAPLVLGALLATTFVVLGRGRDAGPALGIAVLVGGVPARRAAPLALVPPVAAAVSACLARTGGAREVGYTIVLALVVGSTLAALRPVRTGHRVRVDRRARRGSA